ncbi:MAG: mannosyl-3-phosphoglycerate synthase [Zestosphaera sp.]
MGIRLLIRYPFKFETYGAVRIYDVTRTVSLYGIDFEKRHGAFGLTSENLTRIAESTAIVVPVKDEDPLVLEGVLRAVPLHSPLIVVSNSSTKPLDVYSNEVDIAKNIHQLSGRSVIVLHQKDPLIAELLKSEVPDLIDESEGLVRDGKGEGLLIGTLAAEGINSKYVGYVDSDIYIPGAVLEYSLIYYTALAMSRSPYKMVRISWGFKGWYGEEFLLRRWGRVSAVVSSVLNNALSKGRKFETDIIKTSNSGEHAMSIELAKILGFASKYAIETYELVHLLETCYIGLREGLCSALPNTIDILQVESRNPHLHVQKGELHILEMLAESLGVIYHSRLADQYIKNSILRILREFSYEEEPPKPKTYEYPKINARKFLDEILSRSDVSIAHGF